ncbi:RNA polymerase sigma factor [Aliidiomarina celeris]|uniref:RNA polymerase sigma factor n=1 Tax=Aliidiomarina celeris TaxID=2249428 RepID=UPI000DE893CF|nr:sigma-70 family RNA polymerase sigma factor [Aliidiomarina celeris]
MSAYSEHWLEWYSGALALAHQLLKGANTHGHDPADIVQTAYLKAQQQKRLPDDVYAQKAWLLKVVRNACIDVLRVGKKFDPTAADEMAECSEMNAGKQQLIAQERTLQVRRAMASLPLEMREILALRDINDLPYSDIAAVLGIEKGTVMSRLYRARMALKEKLSHWYADQ